MMKDNNNISQGGLAGKMSGFSPEPPEVVWEGISERIGKKKSRRGLIIFLGAAAGLALAITVGVAFFFQKPDLGIADTNYTNTEQSEPSETNLINEPGSADNAENGNSQHGIPSSRIAGQQTSAEPERTGTESRMEKKVRQEVQRVIQETENVELAVVEPGIDPSEPEVFITDVLTDVEDDQNGLEGDDYITIDTESDQNQIINDQVDTEVEVNDDSLWNMLQPDFVPEEDEEDTGIKKGKWSLGASLAPMYTYRDAGSSDLYSTQLANAAESGKVSYGAGINVNFKASEKLTIESGLHYSQMGLNIGQYSSFTNNWFSSDKLAYESSSMRNVVSVSNSIGTIVTSGEDMVTNTYSGVQTSTDYHMLSPGELKVADAGVQSFSQLFEYFEIPFNVKYKIIDKNFKLQLIGGVSTNLLFNTSVLAKTGMGDVYYGEIADVKTFNYSGNAGLGFIYDFPGNFSVCLEPRFKYYLNSINDADLPATRPYAFGIYTGVNYLF